MTAQGNALGIRLAAAKESPERAPYKGVPTMAQSLANVQVHLIFSTKNRAPPDSPRN